MERVAMFIALVIAVCGLVFAWAAPLALEAWVGRSLDVAAVVSLIGWGCLVWAALVGRNVALDRGPEARR